MLASMLGIFSGDDASVRSGVWIQNLRSIEPLNMFSLSSETVLRETVQGTQYKEQLSVSMQTTGMHLEPRAHATV
jgi:hypothetical protein